MSCKVYYWDENKNDLENIVSIYFESLLVRQLFIVKRKENVRKK
ncbi:hypothetical protein LCGC14_1637930 [marine sediment metagenome]|uniref:Uncharacterized protein n=1 Tax=marine sediment metagenome TaxID=412755 RepID=A0A0F9L010_9ZZZZ